MDYPVYKLVINPEVDNISQVDYVALVDFPAIEKDFLMFKAERHHYDIVNEDLRIISGPFMIADKLIFRDNPEMGKHYVQFDAATIKDIVIKFAKKKFNSNVNEMHVTPLAGVTVFESFMCDSKRGIAPMKGYEDAADGSWFGSMYVENDQTWADVKSGKFKGFSVEGMFIYDKPKLTEEQILKKMQELFDLID